MSNYDLLSASFQRTLSRCLLKKSSSRRCFHHTSSWPESCLIAGKNFANPELETHRIRLLRQSCDTPDGSAIIFPVFSRIVS